MPPLVKQILAVAIWTVIWVIIFDIAGVVVSFTLDILVSRHSTTLLFYAVWFVAGIFCGFVHFQQSVERLAKELPDPEPEEGADEEEGEYVEKIPAPLRNGRIVAGVTAGVILILTSLCYRFVWSGQGDVFVPDNIGLSLTYFGAIIIATGFAYRSLS